MVGLNVDDVHSDIPFTKWALHKASVGRVVDLENIEGDEFSRRLRWRIGQFRDDLAVAEHLLRALSGPVKVLDRLVHEDTLECLRLGLADGPMVLGIAKRQQRLAQKRRVRQVWMVIVKGAELDYKRCCHRAFGEAKRKKPPHLHATLQTLTWR